MRGLFFPGAGAQYVGMGKELYDEHRIFQEYFEEASDCLGINFVKLCFASSDAEVAGGNGQLALFVVQAASAGLLRESGVAVDVLLGLDVVSWYSAVHAARGVSFPDGLYILKKWLDATEQTGQAGTLMDPYFEKIDFLELQVPVVDPLCGELLVERTAVAECAKALMHTAVDAAQCVAGLAPWDVGICALPALHAKPRLVFPQTTWYTMETVQEFKSMCNTLVDTVKERAT